MGALFSHILLVWNTVKQLSTLYNGLSNRISLSPGIPIPNPSLPYWVDVPSPIAKHGTDAKSIPQAADVVIIGSGITGTAIARTILDAAKKQGLTPPSIVMFDARDTCYGATARNGGHISPPLYHDYPALKIKYGKDMAMKIMRFRLSHLTNLLAVAEAEGLLEQSQCRKVDAYAVYFDQDLFKAAKEKLAVYCKDLPEESATFKVIEDIDALQKLQISKLAVGCITTVAGAVHPYRLATGILARLLRKYEPHFHLFTNTPCSSINKHSSNGLYDVETSKGTINARHVVYATNAWASHLLPKMRRKIVPARGEMTAQRPGQGLSANWAGTRSFVFYSAKIEARFDYLTQLQPKGEMMFGGGFLQGGVAEDAFFDSVGNVDDSGYNFATSSFLAGALGLYFEHHWGKESVEDSDSDDGRWGKGRIKARWTGILGLSADGNPWVGRIPQKISTKRASTREQQNNATALELCDSGEWICAGFTGEGMTHAWMSGTALAYMIIRAKAKGPPQDEVADWKSWFPDVYLITEKRWKTAKIENLLDE